MTGAEGSTGAPTALGVRGGDSVDGRGPVIRRLGGLGSRQKSTFSCQSPRRVLCLFSRRRGEHQVSHSVEPAPPAKFRAEPSSGLNEAPPAALPAVSGANLQPVERVVTLRAAASAESPLARRARPEMARQALEKPRFAPKNGAPSPLWARPYRIHTSRFSSISSRRAPPSPRSGEGGPIGRRKTPVFRRVMGPDGVRKAGMAR